MSAHRCIECDKKADMQCSNCGEYYCSSCAEASELQCDACSPRTIEHIKFLESKKVKNKSKGE